MRRWTVYILCAMGLLAVSVRGEAQTPAFVDADGDGINDAYQGMHRARGRMRGAGKGDWLTALSKVKLTEEQRARLKQASLDYQKTTSPLNMTFDAAQVKLREAMQAASPDPNAINTQIDAVNALRSQLQKAAAAYQLTVQGILTPEQWAALNAAARDPGVAGPALRGARKGGDDVFIDEDGDGICDGRGVGRRPAPLVKRGPRERAEP
ncbi:Spy/CpxP family protein refolding chaperone [bacterium]|nr:Spy/CpxP family protein refolding chaperone [bacterium]